MAYRTYVTDSLQLIPQSKIKEARWYEIVNQTEQESFDEILSSVIESGGLVIK